MRKSLSIPQENWKGIGVLTNRLRKLLAPFRKFGREVLPDTILAAIFCVLGLLLYVIQRGTQISKNSAKGNIVVLGWRFDNKGSQAMALTVIDQLKRSFPGKNVYFFRYNGSDENESTLYNFPILHFSPDARLRLLLPPLRLWQMNRRHKHVDRKISEIVNHADALIDISGFILSSQWSLRHQIKYLLNIMIARKYAIPFYIFPQSLGPFDYPFRYKIFLYPLLNLYLKYPESVFPREKEGFESVRKFRRRNLEISHDIVIQNKGYDLSNIYKNGIRFKEFNIESGAVGLVPNLRMMQQTNPESVFSAYKSLIEELIERKKEIYIFRHSKEDLQVCEATKKLFQHCHSVRLIVDDLHCIELENLIKQFDFLIACRYHAVVHAYKNNVPCLVVGWAAKYFDLMEHFGQQNYLFDCRYGVSIDDISNALVNMIHKHSHESSRIAEKLQSIQGARSRFHNTGQMNWVAEKLLSSETSAKLKPPRRDSPV